MAKQEKGPHRLAHKEDSLCTPVELRTLGKGDVCIRQGAPHMVVDLGTNVRTTYDVKEDEERAVWVCNLQSGSVWPTSGSEQVYPALDVMLNLRTARREY